MGLREHLTAIYEKHGELTPAIVVEEARDKSHPLHGVVFDRPLKEAAEAWYYERARRLIRVAMVRYEVGNEQREVRAFHSVYSEEGYRFEPLERVVQDDVLRTIVLRDMERDWRALKRRYDHFEEFAQMILDDLRDEAA